MPQARLTPPLSPSTHRSHRPHSTLAERRNSIEHLIGEIEERLGDVMSANNSGVGSISGLSNVQTPNGSTHNMSSRLLELGELFRITETGGGDSGEGGRLASWVDVGGPATCRCWGSQF